MKCKIKMLFAFMLCMPFFMQAQITFTTQVPNTGILLKEQLWNMIVVNNSNDIAVLRMEVDITDLLLGQSVLNASTGKIVVAKGMKMITSRDVQPVTYNFVAAEFAGNYAPCGSYTVHYRLLQEIPGKGEVQVANEITRIYVTPLSPPLLTTPGDKAGIETIYPQFTWMPPVPIEMFSPLVYDINVVSVEEGQSAREAIEINRPVYFNTNIQNTAEKMSTAYEALQQGKKYAWQVVARSGMACASPSEIWVFTIGKDSVTKIIENAPFTKLSRNSTEVTIAQDGVVKMEYINNCDDKQVKCTVYKAGDREKAGHKAIRFVLDLTSGPNYLSYNVSKKAKLDDKTVYEISLKNSRGEEWMMRFMPVFSNK